MPLALIKPLSIDRETATENEDTSLIRTFQLSQRNSRNREVPLYNRQLRSLFRLGYNSEEKPGGVANHVTYMFANP